MAVGRVAEQPLSYDDWWGALKRKGCNDKRKVAEKDWRQIFRLEVRRKGSGGSREEQAKRGSTRGVEERHTTAREESVGEGGRSARYGSQSSSWLA